MRLTLPEAYTNQKPLYRALPIDEVSVADDGFFQVAGQLVPYDVEKEIGPGVTEVFRSGAFKRAGNAPGRIKFFGVSGGDGHQGEPVGHGVTIEDRSSGPFGTFKIIDTAAGIDTAKLINSGTLDELSVVFTTLPDQFSVSRRGQGIHVEHRSARLLGVAAVPVGAYGRDALVTQARSLLSAERDALIAKLKGLKS